MTDERQDKNGLFNASDVQPQADNNIRKSMGTDIPHELVPLPSEGKVYPQDHPLFNKSVVEILPMTAKEEDILTSPALIKKGTVIQELIKSCLLDTTINPGTLLSGDRNALMVAIRISGYGPLYEAEIKCDECGKTTQRKFDLSKLDIKPLTIEPSVPNQNIFDFRLPKSGKTVRFKFLTADDEKNISLTAERLKKAYNTQKEWNVTVQLQHLIVGVQGEEKLSIQKFVQEMPAFDSTELRKYVRKHEPGISMKATSTCPECDHEEEVGIPLGPKFLWPNAE